MTLAPFTDPFFFVFFTYKMFIGMKIPVVTFEFNLSLPGRLQTPAVPLATQPCD